MIKRIGVLTSGGDAPGMNAAIRAVTRTAIDQGWEVMGIEHGYAGLLEGHMIPFTLRSVGGIIQQGGTILGSARSQEFKTEAGHKRALDQLEKNQIDALVVIGGNGSQTGSLALAKLGFPVNGVASTIDNDLMGSDVTIGVDTALNIALEAIDRLKVTASSHKRAFLIEVMGRDCGYLALMSGIAGGAEAIVIPEFPTTPELVADAINTSYARGKSHAIIVVAEGANYKADQLVHYFTDNKSRLGYELRASTLGHMQRGGAPNASDRLLGTRLGARAVESLAKGESGSLAGMINNKIVMTPFGEIVGKQKPLDPELLRLADVLAK